MLGLVCVALLYTIPVTRDTRRNFMWSCCESHAVVEKEAWEREFRDLSVRRYVNHLTEHK